MQPLRIPPAVGQFSHDAGGGTLGKRALGFVHNGGSGTSDSCDVLQKDESRTAIGSDSEDFVEQTAALAIKSGAATGDTDVLARESSNDAIHDAAPTSAIEGCDIVPDRRLIQCLSFHPRHESGRCIGVPLNVTHTAIVESQQVEASAHAFVEHADAGEEGESGKLGTWSHMLSLLPPHAAVP